MKLLAELQGSPLNNYHIDNLEDIGSRNAEVLGDFDVSSYEPSPINTEDQTWEYHLEEHPGYWMIIDSNKECHITHGSKIFFKKVIKKPNSFISV